MKKIVLVVFLAFLCAVRSYAIRLDDVTTRVSPQIDVRAYGADPTGAVESTAAILSVA